MHGQRKRAIPKRGSEGSSDPQSSAYWLSNRTSECPLRARHGGRTRKRGGRQLAALTLKALRQIWSRAAHEATATDRGVREVLRHEVPAAPPGLTEWSAFRP